MANHWSAWIRTQTNRYRFRKSQVCEGTTGLVSWGALEIRALVDYTLFVEEVGALTN